MSAPTVAPRLESTTVAEPDPREPVTRLLRDLRSGPAGLSERDAARRLERYGGWVLVLLVPMPLLVWGIDEIYRALRCTRSSTGQ